MGKYLSGAAGPAAQYGTAEMLRLMPYEKGTSEHYGRIQFRDGNRRHISCQTKILSRELADELGNWYLPGGISIEYIQQQNGDWLVCFKSNNILASAYMRLAEGEMQKLLAGVGELR